MPWYFYLTMGAAALTTVAALLIRVAPAKPEFAGDPSPKGLAKAATGLFGSITLLLTVVSSLTFTPANEVGIVTNFGAWSGTRSSGISLTMPWSQMDTFGTRNQRSIRDRAETEGSANCVEVNMASGSTGCQDVTVLYSIDEANAEKLWRGWKDFGKLNVDLIQRQTDDAMLTVYPKYTPLEAQGLKRGEITAQVSEQLRNRLAPQGINLESVTLGTIHLPEKTQKNLNDLVDADTRLQIALKGEAQAQAEARTNAARQQSLTPEALVMECLKTAREVKPQIMPSCGLGAAGEAGALVSLGGNR